MDEIKNKVAGSGLITIDLEELYPSEVKFEGIDIKNWIFQESILIEKEFRQTLKEVNWKIYSNSNVYLFCSSDAILPLWTYMLICSQLYNYANTIVVGSLDDLNNCVLQKIISKKDYSVYKDKRVIIKGCSSLFIKQTTYTMLTNKLLPLVKSLMFGEACSTVPIYKSNT